MKRAKEAGRPARGADSQHDVLFEQANKGGGDNKGHEVSSIRMLENLKLALFFSRVQGRMARGEQ